MLAHLSPEFMLDLPNLATHECGHACREWEGHVDLCYLNDAIGDLDVLWATWHQEIIDALPDVSVHGFEFAKEAPDRDGWTALLVVYDVYDDRQGVGRFPIEVANGR